MPAENLLSDEVRQMYHIIKSHLLKMADEMPEESYSFKPTPDVRTFGELVGHVADAQAFTCSRVNGSPQTVEGGEKQTKAQLVAALKESFAICDQAFDELTDANATDMITLGKNQRSRLGLLTATVAHSCEEYGYMAVYLRLNAVVPPSSEGR